MTQRGGSGGSPICSSAYGVLPGSAPVPWALQWRRSREPSPTTLWGPAVHCWKICGLGCRSTFFGSLGNSQDEEFLGLPPQAFASNLPTGSFQILNPLQPPKRATEVIWAMAFRPHMGGGIRKVQQLPGVTQLVPGSVPQSVLSQSCSI